MNQENLQGLKTSQELKTLRDPIDVAEGEIMKLLDELGFIELPDFHPRDNYLHYTKEYYMRRKLQGILMDLVEAR